MAVQEKPQRVEQAGDKARGWGALIGLTAVVLGVVAFLLPEGGAGDVLLMVAGWCLLGGFVLVVLGVLARALTPTRR